MNQPTQKPLIFSDFFAVGFEEEFSPFLTTKSLKWGANLPLKSSILSAILLFLAFLMVQFSPTQPLGYLLLIFVYFIAGIPSLIEAIEDVLSLEINIDVLMTLAAFSSVLIGSGFEGGLLLVLFALAGSIEQAVKTKAKSALNTLHKLSPTKATVVEEDGKLIERAIQDISVNTPILVKAGQVIPLDGDVIEGTSSVNLVHITGESLPVTKKVGDSVAAGARNLDGALILTVTRVNTDSTISKIIQLVTQAQESKPKLQQWFSKLSRRYATTIIALSGLFALYLPLLTSTPFFGPEGSIYRALAFLIAASPCALIIAMPIAYLSAISACARKGILLKGGVILDALSGCTTVAFDKTGTLTTGELTCSSIEPLLGNRYDKDTALAFAYAMEKNAVHPIAHAIVTMSQEKEIKKIQLDHFRAVPGYGLEATTTAEGKTLKLFIGLPEYIEKKIAPSSAELLKERVQQAQKQGKLVSILAIEEELYLFLFEDTLRPRVKSMTQSLKERFHLKLLMLSGDHKRNAEKIATELKIDNVKADLRPEDKLQLITELTQKEKVAMIGDGINDAPALARAHVGICMGKVGSTAAIDAADAVLLNDNIEFLSWLFAKAKKTKAIVRQNLFIAASAIIIASFPALLGFVPLWLAVILHEGGTLLVGLNALRLLK